MRKKILLVDDQNTVLMVERMMLKDAGYEVITARDGEEAVKKAMKERPDLILLDVQMPKMDGLEVCRTLRKEEQMKSLPIIMVTSRGEPANVQAGYAAGCTAYVTKPFNSVELLEKLEGLLARTETTR